MLDTVLDIILDALVDTAKLVPFLFVTYLLMEWLEHRTSKKTKAVIKNSGRFGPLFGGLLGAIPQCGFSAAVSNLYAGKIITMGTLVAIYLSTSDEMLPIMISEKVPVSMMLSILGLKIVIGMVAGFVIDAVASLVAGRSRQVDKIEAGISHVCEHDHCHCEKSIVKSALKHTLVITVFVLIVSLALNAVLAAVGEETLASFILDRPFMGPVVTSLVGLIPNCAASVVITQLYLQGVLSFGSMMAGLLTGSGVGILVLCRVNDQWRDNAKIIALVYGIGVLCGIAINLIG